MNDPAAAEIDALVMAAGADEEPEPEADPPKKKRRRVARAKTNGSKEVTQEELEAEELLEGRVLPKPAQNVKTVGDMYAKYRIGDDPDFRVQVWRTWPKMFPGGKKADGYYDTWEQELSLEQIQAEYGGGTYRIAIVGPHPTQPRRTKHYDSVSVQIAGDPKFERVPRALQGQEPKGDSGGASVPMQPMMPMAQESPKLAEAALKMIDGVAERERADRHRAEELAAKRVESAQSMLSPVIDAERRRADDVLAAERRAAEHRERVAEERLAEERRRNDEMRRRMEMQQNSQSGFAESLRALADSGLMGRDDGVAKTMLSQILEKHRSEMEAIQRQHVSFVESIRTGHQTELAAIREAHRREMEAEREASRNREARIEERLTSEREERRRDQERFRETQTNRDQQWKDRMEQQEATIKSSWESRHQALISTYENRLQWMQGEVDRLKQESYDLRQKREEAGDPITQIAKMAELRSVMKDALGVDTSSSGAQQQSSSGGIGLSGASEGLMEGLLERAPEIVGAVMGGFQRPQQQPQQQPQYQLGQIVPTPQGEMIVVPAPQAPGGMALAPRAAVEAHQRQQAAAQQPPQLLGGPPPQRQSQPRPRVMPDADEMRRREKKTISAVPNFAEGLPKRRPAWEGGGEEPVAAPPVEEPELPRHPPRMTSRPEPPDPDEPMKLSSMERQGLQVIAKLVHDSVMEADEPEEFVAKVTQQYGPDVLQQIVGAYTTDQIVQGIVQLQPNSAGATPAGQQFVRHAFRQLRVALRG